MKSQEFFESFFNIYKTQYSDQEYTEINDLLYDLNIDQIEILYDHIRKNYKYKTLPGYNYIYKTCEELRFIKKKTGKLEDKIYRQTPLYQIELARDWTAKTILEHVIFIRKKQDQLLKNGLSMMSMKTEDISFLSIWDVLRDIKPENLEIAKQRIVESGEKELHADTKVNLNDLMMPLIKVKNIENKKVIREIPF